MENRDNLKLIYEENFETDLELGDWYKADHPYKKIWAPLDVQIGPADEYGEKNCILTPTNAFVKDGRLTLLATECEDAYHGVELRTHNFYSYGYFEIDAKINASRGICPAFWLLGSRDAASKIEYEIDGFECFGDTPDIIKYTLLAHNYPNGPTSYAGTTYAFEHFERLTDDLSPVAYANSYFSGPWNKDFHKFAVDWKPGMITWLVDGKPLYRVDTAKSLNGKYPYNEPLKVILTIYSGRNVCFPKTGLPDETTDWENGNSFVIKSIKFYEYDIKEKLI